MPRSIRDKKPCLMPKPYGGGGIYRLAMECGQCWTYSPTGPSNFSALTHLWRGKPELVYHDFDDIWCEFCALYGNRHFSSGPGTLPSQTGVAQHSPNSGASLPVPHTVWPAQIRHSCGMLLKVQAYTPYHPTPRASLNFKKHAFPMKWQMAKSRTDSNDRY